MNSSSRAAAFCVSASLLSVALTAQTVSVTVNSTVTRDRVANPLALGFNLEWNGFQRAPYNNSNLWDGATKLPRPELITFLKNDFSGATYRYPGGMGGVFEWEKSVGPASGRPVQYNSTAHQYQVVLFGFDEAVAFAKSAGGNILPVMNIYWMDGNVVSDANWPALKQRQLGWLEYANAPVNADWNGDGINQGQLRADNGHPAPYNIKTWELGNETDDNQKMNSATFISRCQDLINAMEAVQPDIDFLIGGRTAPWGPKPLLDPQPPLSPGQTVASWRDWHNAFLPVLGHKIWAISMHPYYDGHSVNSINGYTNTTWNDSKAWALGAGTTAPGIAVTENAVWPSNLDDQATWPRTTAMQSIHSVTGNPLAGGAVSVIDYAISHHQTASTQLLINHELVCQGPWALFSQFDPTTNRYVINNVFAPRPLAHSLRLMSRISKTADVLQTNAPTSTPNASGYGYDVRAMGYKHGSSGIQGALLVNRANADYTLNLTLPAWSAGAQVVRIDAIGGPDPTQLWRRYVSTQVASNQGALKLPGFSVFNATALGANLAMNADFENGTTGSTPTSWVQRINTGLTGTTHRTADATMAVNGSNIVRLQTTATNSGLSLVQPDWVNPVLNSTGLMSANLNDTYVLRANVRTSGTVAAKVRARVQLFNTAGFVTSSPMSLAAPADTAGTWVPLEVEFVPATILAGTSFNRAEIMLSNDSSTGYADFDGVTLFRRQNTAANPGLLDTTPANGIEDSWGRRNSGTGSISYNGSGAPKYVRLSKTVAGDGNQFYQTHTSTSSLGNRLHEKWRLRARVRHNGLNAAGAQLKVQLFDSAGAYLSSSPLGPVLTGTSSTSGSGWVETVLEFNPRELVGAATFGKAEIMMQNNSSTGYVDVSFLSLEAVD